VTEERRTEAKWSRPDLLRVEDKKQGRAYKWAREDNVDRLREEGWEVCQDTGLRIDQVEGDGTSVDTTIRRRELVLMEMPEELAESRREHYRRKAEEQLQAIRERYQEEAERQRFRIHQRYERR
jgi:hypothetical protein